MSWAFASEALNCDWLCWFSCVLHRKALDNQLAVLRKTNSETVCSLFRFVPDDEESTRLQWVWKFPAGIPIGMGIGTVMNPSGPVWIVIFICHTVWQDCTVHTCTRYVYSGADSIGHGGTCPHFYKWLGTRGTVSRRTANKKLTKLYWPSRKRSPKRLIALLEPKKVQGHDQKNFSGASCRIGAPTFAPDGTVHVRDIGVHNQHRKYASNEMTHYRICYWR